MAYREPKNRAAQERPVRPKSSEAAGPAVRQRSAASSGASATGRSVSSKTRAAASSVNRTRSGAASSGRKRKSKRKLKPFVPFLIAGLAVVIIAVIVIIIASGSSAKRNADSKDGAAAITQEADSSDGSAGEGSTDAETTEASTEPAEPVVTSSLSFGSTGDILIHPSVLTAFETEDGHDFTGAFTYVAPYYKDLDLMIANLEVPLVDPEDGYPYSSNPFASPDAVAEALKDAGVDICLTANNHTCDMGNYGLMRTQEVLESLGIEYTGTRKNASDSFILSKTVNDIKLGMICYTYENGPANGSEHSLNFNPLSDEDIPRVNMFDYNDLETFYADAREQLAAMEKDGCDVKVFYLHWGEEYEDYPNETQEGIAQELCDMGVDIIIGGHPHVVQAFDVLESENGHQMLCLYSMGNELSNQRRDIMNEDDFRGYTEDGIIFIIHVDKYSDGKVVISGADAIPTWVQRDDSFEIIPLDPEKDASEWPVSDYYMGAESYNRTMGRLSDAFFSYRESCGQSDIPQEVY